MKIPVPAHQLRVAVLGFGEAGGAFARDLVPAGADVRGFDPKVVAPEGVTQRSGDADAVRDADLVFNLTTGTEAESALRAALPGLRPGTVWAEANTVSPALKVRLAELVDEVGGDLVDVAIMAPVPGQGLRTPMAAAGPAAPLFVTMMSSLGVAIEPVPGPIGAASARKLLRSVVYKGLAAAVVEAMAGAAAAGCAEWFHEHLTTEFVKFDADMIDRLISGTYTHAHRRTEEMTAAAQQLADLGITPHIASATRDALQAITTTHREGEQCP
ncbi:DUF1932 domain-containing protein [Nocardia sp. NPDC052112]|uniref:NAD(P)-dependent oxidoreductase n=1 Tax=Nocardia sp. NPDC052112 TaxID=3155646 RepID=UPI003426896C